MLVPVDRHHGEAADGEDRRRRATNRTVGACSQTWPEVPYILSAFPASAEVVGGGAAVTVPGG
jgi:hypothetical protein